jgi:hypothetical protein
MKIYIASSWKNKHAVEMLTTELRNRNHEVFSFVEMNYGEGVLGASPKDFNAWYETENAWKAFKYDTDGATKSDLVIYISPAGCDAWAEIGAAWASGVRVVALNSKAEQAGLMRKMVYWWYDDHKVLLEELDKGVP